MRMFPCYTNEPQYCFDSQPKYTCVAHQGRINVRWDGTDNMDGVGGGVLGGGYMSSIM